VGPVFRSAEPRSGAGLGLPSLGSINPYQGCKQAECHNRWVPATGWTRVSRGSHAGHLPVDVVGHDPLRLRPRYPGTDVHERTSTGDGLRLVPLERVDTRHYRPLEGGGVRPPWRKRAWREPEGGTS
jgi:hypothetical protein